MSLDRATLFAAKCHAGQFRKYPNAFGVVEPYLMHPARVAGLVANSFSRISPHMLTPCLEASWCHDVMEDCNVDFDTLVNETSYACAVLVSELTNPSKQFPWLRRTARKKMDRDHLSVVSREAKIIKMFDRMDNVSGVIYAPMDFALLYLDESQKLAETLRTADESVFNALICNINKVRFFLDSR